VKRFEHFETSFAKIEEATGGRGGMRNERFRRKKSAENVSFCSFCSILFHAFWLELDAEGYVAAFQIRGRS
jgi:hypothetical protein